MASDHLYVCVFCEKSHHSVVCQRCHYQSGCRTTTLAYDTEMHVHEIGTCHDCTALLHTLALGIVSFGAAEPLYMAVWYTLQEAEHRVSLAVMVLSDLHYLDRLAAVDALEPNVGIDLAAHASDFFWGLLSTCAPDAAAHYARFARIQAIVSSSLSEEFCGATPAACLTVCICLAEAIARFWTTPSSRKGHLISVTGRVALASRPAGAWNTRQVYTDDVVRSAAIGFIYYSTTDSTRALNLVRALWNTLVPRDLIETNSFLAVTQLVAFTRHLPEKRVADLLAAQADTYQQTRAYRTLEAFYEKAKQHHHHPAHSPSPDSSSMSWFERDAL